MKKIYIASFFLFTLAACKSTLPISTNPDKGSFNSGTIGSVRSTDNLPVAMPALGTSTIGILAMCKN